MKEYLTDEELELFIEQLEQQELYAPRHMKEQILSKAFPKQTEEAQPGSGGGKRSVQLFSYRLKIIAGMAAALLMLVILPMQGELRESQGKFESTEKWEESLQEKLEEEAQEEKIPDLNYILNGGVRRAGERLNAWINRLDHIELDSIFGRKTNVF